MKRPIIVLWSILIAIVLALGYFGYGYACGTKPIPTPKPPKCWVNCHPKPNPSPKPKPSPSKPCPTKKPTATQPPKPSKTPPPATQPPSTPVPCTNCKHKSVPTPVIIATGCQACCPDGPIYVLNQSTDLVWITSAVKALNGACFTLDIYNVGPHSMDPNLVTEITQLVTQNNGSVVVVLAVQNDETWAENLYATFKKDDVCVRYGFDPYWDPSNDPSWVIPTMKDLGVTQ
jgi:hypothetical protein